MRVEAVASKVILVPGGQRPQAVSQGHSLRTVSQPQGSWLGCGLGPYSTILPYIRILMSLSLGRGTL